MDMKRAEAADERDHTLTIRDQSWKGWRRQLSLSRSALPADRDGSLSVLASSLLTLHENVIHRTIGQHALGFAFHPRKLILCDKHPTGIAAAPLRAGGAARVSIAPLLDLIKLPLALARQETDLAHARLQHIERNVALECTVNNTGDQDRVPTSLPILHRRAGLDDQSPTRRKTPPTLVHCTTRFRKDRITAIFQILTSPD
jgi:hypothetical protein